MHSGLGRAVKNIPDVAVSALGTLGAAFGGQLLLLVSGILAARMLGPEDRGHLALLALIPAVLVTIVLFGSDTALTYFIAKNRDQALNIVRTTALPAIAQTVLCIMAQGVAIWLLVRGETREIQLSGLVSLGVAPAMVAQNYGLRLLQGLQRFRRYNILRLIPLSLYSLLVVAAFLLGVTSLFAVTSAWAAAYTTSAVAIVLVAKRDLPTTEVVGDRVSIGQIMRFGAKGFLGSASPLETFRLDQLVVGLFLTPTVLGIYVASLAFTNLPRFIAQSLGTVALPYIASRPTRSAAYRAMWKFFVVSLTSTIVVATILIVGAGFFVPFFFGQAFNSAVRPAQILLLGAVLFSARRILTEALRGLGYATIGTHAELASWAALVPALALLVPRWELNGVAAATVIASGLGFAVVFLYALVADRRSEVLEATHPSTILDSAK